MELTKGRGKGKSGSEEGMDGGTCYVRGLRGVGIGRVHKREVNHGDRSCNNSVS